MFHHFIVTRYSLLRVNPEWQARRLELLRAVYLPSLQSQTNPNFSVKLLVNDRMPRKFRLAMEDCFPDDRFSVVTTGFSHYNFKDADRRWLRDWLLKETGAEFLITTRVDSDDAVAVDFVERIQDQFAEQVDTAVSFPYGYTFVDGMYYLRRYPGNMFLSMISPRDSCRHCHQASHGRLTKEFDTVYVDDSPGWVHFRHSEAATAKDIRVPLHFLSSARDVGRERFVFDRECFASAPKT